MFDDKDIDLYIRAIQGDQEAKDELRFQIEKSILRSDELAEAHNEQIRIDLIAMQAFGLYTGDQEVFDL
jgi:hypothetical protein